MLRPLTMSGKIVGVLGLGRSGMAAAASLSAGGAEIYLHDDHSKPDDIPTNAHLADWQDWPWDDIDMMVISPGIPHLYPAPHPCAAHANDHAIPIISEIEVAMMAAPAAQIVAITGTNGKSTTTALIGHCLANAGWPVAVGGNIGTAACGLDDPGDKGVIVLELSSYQLETTPSLRADCAVLINISPDHLDRHNGFDGYVEAKARILSAVNKDGVAVIGTGDTHVRALAQNAAASGIRTITIDADRTGAHDTCDNIALRGSHNAENVAIARAVLAHLDMDDAAINAGIDSFAGLPHRMQQVASNDQINFINDSKATNGVAAAKSLSAFDNIYWIAGGKAKEDGLDAVQDALDNVVATYLIGASANEFAKSLDGRMPITMCGDIKRATHAAYKDASASGDPATILLAPAAASFDQFASFVDRGNEFAAIARDLAPPIGGAHA